MPPVIPPHFQQAKRRMRVGLMEEVIRAREDAPRVQRQMVDPMGRHHTLFPGGKDVVDGPGAPVNGRTQRNDPGQHADLAHLAHLLGRPRLTGPSGDLESRIGALIGQSHGRMRQM